jgi:ubiquinone/menaquinone biosynthesis C-methylase UbiE
MDTWQLVLLTILLLLLANYAYRIFYDRIVQKDIHSVEGFEDGMEVHGWIEDPYDKFYATAYNKIFQHDKLVQAETAIVLQDWKKKGGPLKILDVCCGTGVATTAFIKQGSSSAVGLDKSVAMLNFAQDTILPATTLTPEEVQRIEWRNTDAYSPMACQAFEFTHACLLFFSIYYFKDLDVLFKNLALWVKPGGGLVIEVVNKYKFVPILDSGNPWVGISPQNYSKERITKSSAAFDAFDYESVFELNDPQAEFRETFRFKDGSVRRQKHTLVMPNIPDIIKKAARNGWNYTKYVDLMPLSFQYGYLLFFTRQSN